MSQRRNHKPNMKPSTCNKCLNQAHAVPGTVHRRCPGQPDQPIRPKHQGIEPASGRGRWE
jgi:hypothetical protein